METRSIVSSDLDIVAGGTGLSFQISRFNFHPETSAYTFPRPLFVNIQCLNLKIVDFKSSHRGSDLRRRKEYVGRMGLDLTTSKLIR